MYKINLGIFGTLGVIFWLWLLFLVMILRNEILIEIKLQLNKQKHEIRR